MEPMSDSDHPVPEFLPVAEIAIDAVVPSPSGFLLEGAGADGAQYRLEMHLDLPVDRRTRQVLGELLSQSEWRVLRRTVGSPLTNLRRERARARQAARRADGT